MDVNIVSNAAQPIPHIEAGVDVGQVAVGPASSSNPPKQSPKKAYAEKSEGPSSAAMGSMARAGGSRTTAAPRSAAKAPAETEEGAAEPAWPLSSTDSRSPPAEQGPEDMDISPSPLEPLTGCPPPTAGMALPDASKT